MMMERTGLLPELTAAEEKELFELAELLEHPIVLGEVGAQVVDLVEPEKVIREHRQPMRSWTRNFFDNLAAGMCMVNWTTSTPSPGGLCWRNISGTWLGYTGYGAGSPGLEAPQANVNYGIVVGTGVGAEDFDGYAMSSLVAHGTGAGQLFYYAQGRVSRDWVLGTRVWTFTHNRFMNNYSGGDIVVTEIGMMGTLYSSSSQNYGLLSRDLLGASVTVSNLQQLRATYTITMPAMPS
jgi:hypothetical protein